ncbi:MAG: glycosyltransferase [Planctomycetaceae bacterium]|nr:glycosyltransferase [Planctomycetaceae bacterium]
MSQSSAQAADATLSSAGETVVKKQIRGSSVLLVGRGCSLLMNLITQIVIVRYLLKTDYGALAYVLSLVEMGSLGAAFCMDKTFARFGAIYHERGEKEKFLGAWVLAATVPLVTGGLLIALALAAGQHGSTWLQLQPAELSMLMIAVWLVPANAMASVVLALATVMRGARAVFVRKHLIGPLLKLAAVLFSVACGSSATGVAAALLIAGLCSAVIDAGIAIRILREDGFWGPLKMRQLVIPLREFFGYSLPLLSSDLAWLARGTLMVVFLGWLASASGTASFRAILPVVRLNELVIINFTVMFMPLASRLFARGATRELSELYGKTRTWVAMLSFPVFAACVAMSQPLTVLLFGHRYADAASLLVILATGYYIQACFGFNGSLLRVLGHVHLLVLIDVAAAVLALGAAWLLIPVWEAVGAAVCVSGGIAVHCGLRTAAVYCLVPDRSTPAASPQPLLRAMLLGAGLTAVSLVTEPGWISGALMVLTSTLLLWWWCRKWFEVSSIFPEFRRIAGWDSSPSSSQVASSTTCELPARAEGEQQPAPLRVAYIMSRFPRLTETFVLREMVEMERLGAQVDVYPLQREWADTVHPAAEPFVRRAYFTPWLSVSILASNLRQLLRQPVTYCFTLLTLLRANFGSLRFFSGACMFFPKAVHLAEVMQRQHIDHVHAHFASHPAAVAWVIRRMSGIPFSFTAHGSDLHRDRHMLQEKAAEAAAVVTISEYNRQLILNECPAVPPGRVQVIHCGINPDDLTHRTEPTAYTRGEGPLQILCIGTLHEVKGQRYLLEACAELRRRNTSLHCHFIGDGPDRRELTELAVALEIAAATTFHGLKTAPEVADLLQMADIVVAPSVPTRCGRREGIPVVLMEALGSGVPVVASDLSGIPELVQNERTGLLTPPRHSCAVADALERLAGSTALRQRLADCGRDLVLRDFHAARNAEALKLLIESLTRSEVPSDDRNIDGERPVDAVPVPEEEICPC